MADRKASAFTTTAPALTDEIPFIRPLNTVNHKNTIENHLALYDARVKTLTNTSYDALGTGNVLTNIGSAHVVPDIITGFAEDLTPQATQDFILSWDFSAGALKKIKISSLPSGDNLGNHTATTDLLMANNKILNTNLIELNEITTPATPAANKLRLYGYDRAGRTALRYVTPTALEVQIAQDNIIVCRNQSATTINKGDAVYISGSQANDRPRIAKAQANSEATMPAVGIAMETILNTNDGWVMFAGKLDGLDTSSFSENDILYVSQTTAGLLTTTKPPLPDNFPQVMARVISSHPSTGSLLIIPATMRGNVEGTNLDRWLIGNTSTAAARFIELHNSLGRTQLSSSHTTNRSLTIPDLDGTFALVGQHTHVKADITDTPWALGSEVTGASTNLTDTGVIVRTDQPNTYAAAQLQTFQTAQIRINNAGFSAIFATNVATTDKTITFANVTGTVLLTAGVNTVSGKKTFTGTASAAALAIGNQDLTSGQAAGDIYRVTDDIRYRNNANNANITILGDTTTNIVTSKTINATDNTITDNSQALGDLLKNNGSKFVRFGIGSANQQIRVNAGGTDLEYFTPSGGAGDMILASVQTSTGKKTFAADATLAGFNLNNQVPSAPVAGDIWRSVDTLQYRNNAGSLTHNVVSTENANTYGTGLKQSFVPSTTNAGLNIGTITAADPSAPVDGDMWINTNAPAILRYRGGGATQQIVNLTSAQTGISGAKTMTGLNTILMANTGLTIRNVANTFSYTIAGGAIGAARTITLPLLLGNDVMVTEAFIQALTGKTIVAASNTITDTSAALGDILRFDSTRFARFARGATGQFLRATASDIAYQNIEFTKGGTVLDPAATARNIIAWRAPFACTVTNVRGYRTGGSAASINARKNGSLTHLASNLSISSADTWTDGGAVQNTSYAAGDKLEIMIISTAGSPTEVAIQVDYTRP